MVRALFFALALPAIASAAVCTETDFLPLVTSSIACSTASGISATAMQGTSSPADIVKMCQYPACQTFFQSFSSLKCTDAAGNSVAVAGSACSVLASGTTAKPAATNSGVATALSAGAIVVATAVSMM